MKALLTIFALASMVTTAAAQAQTPPSTYAVSTQAKIEYAQHDGVTLTVSGIITEVRADGLVGVELTAVVDGEKVLTQARAVVRSGR